MEHGSALIPRDTITEIVAYRDAAIGAYEAFVELLEQAHEKRRRAEEMVAKACQGEFSIPYSDAREVEAFREVTKLPDPEGLKRASQRLTDLQVWRAIIARTDLEVLMDKTAKAELSKQLTYVPEKVDRQSGRLINADEIAKRIPPVTEEHIQATLEGFAARSGEIWRRGLAKAFSALDRRFRSHDGFKVGSRMILSRAFDQWGSWSHYHHRDTLLDIERAFLVLDGRRPTAAYAGIVGAIGAERSGIHSAHQSEHEGEYFKVRVFQNGNAHLWFTRPDLVDQVNQELAEYYGAGLGWGKADQEDPEAPFAGAVDRAPAKNYGLFPTPDSLADEVIEAARLWSSDPLRILEPSAGTGQLAMRAIRPHEEAAQHMVTAVELQSALVADLQQVKGVARVLQADFLAMEADPIYDRVIMNPPFDRGRDIDHVNHALGFVRPGGRLAAIMSASAEVSSSKKAEAFRAKVKRLGGRFRDLPEGSFRECGTNVNVVLLTISKRA